MIQQIYIIFPSDKDLFSKIFSEYIVIVTTFKPEKNNCFTSKDNDLIKIEFKSHTGNISLKIKIHA